MKQKTNKEGTKTVIRITNKLMSGSLVGRGKDKDLNPIHGFLTIGYVTPEEFDNEMAEFKSKYPDVKLQNGAHKILTGFQEVLNNGKRLKEVTQYIEQEIYENGKWRKMKPGKEGEHVVDSSEKKGITTKGKVVLGVVGLIVLAILVKVLHVV